MFVSVPVGGGLSIYKRETSIPIGRRSPEPTPTVAMAKTADFHRDHLGPKPVRETIVAKSARQYAERALGTDRDAQQTEVLHHRNSARTPCRAMCSTTALMAPCLVAYTRTNEHFPHAQRRPPPATGTRNTTAPPPASPATTCAVTSASVGYSPSDASGAAPTSDVATTRRQCQR